MTVLPYREVDSILPGQFELDVMDMREERDCLMERRP